MKKVIIIGAGGSLAGPVIEALQKQADVELTLFLRNKRKLSASRADKQTVIEGDVLDYPVLKRAICGHDIVYINLAGILRP
jgi:Saccharopine dehydrogenase and related proteins